MGLVDLNGGLGRVDGGVGLALEDPHVELRAESSEKLEAHGPMGDRALRAASAVVDSIRGDPVALEVREAFPQHVGLGSGTQVALAAGTAAAHLNGETLSTRDVAEITGRGGTSGIGVASFEGGGMVLDGGHALSDKEGFLPSSESPAPPPPVLSRLDFPDWEVTVFIPEGEGAHGAEEVEVFERECPLPEGEVGEVARIVLMKLLPSVAEGDFRGFREAVRLLQGTGFKRREVEMNPRSKELLDELYGRGCAAGMSSFGPAVYAVHPFRVNGEGIDAEVFRTRASDSGAEVSG